METKHHFIKEGIHLGLDLAKIAIKTGLLVAAFLTVKELHKVHKSIEAKHSK